MLQFTPSYVLVSFKNSSVCYDCLILEVDPELRPERVKKTFQVHDSILRVEYNLVLRFENNSLVYRIQAKDLRVLRASSTGFCDHARVVVDTLRHFGPQSTLISVQED